MLFHSIVYYIQDGSSVKMVDSNGYSKFYIGSPNDFEITRFAHDVISEIDLKTDINYEFYFWNTGSVTPISATTIVNEIDWKNSYIFEGFNTKEIYYYTKPFTNIGFSHFRTYNVTICKKMAC